MTHSKLTWLLTLFGALVVVGCGDSSNSSTPPGEETVNLELRVIEFEPGELDMPLEGAEVCLLDTGNCETSDADGMLTITLPANADNTLTVMADGYAPTLVPQTTVDVDITGLQAPLLTEQIVTLMAGVLNTPYPFEDSGVIAISAVTDPPIADDNGIAGVTYASGDAPPYYLDENGFPTFDIAETTEPDGAGGYVELAAAEYEITLGGTASNCVNLSAWPGSTADTIRLPVLAGFITQGLITCDPVAP